MKKATRIAALFIAAVLVLCLTACGGQADPLIAARANMEAASSMDACVVMNMEMEIAGESFKTATTMDMTLFTEPMRMKIESATEAAGQSAVITIYAEEDGDGAYAMYVHDGANWYSTTVDPEALGQYEVNENLTAYLESAGSFKQEGTETVDGVSAYKYTGVITGENMKEVMARSGALETMSALGVDSARLEDMLSDLGGISVRLWISEEELYPVRYEMDMTAVMDGLMRAVLEGLGGDAEGLTVGVPEMTLAMTFSNFNSAAGFTVPDEARQ